MRELKYPAIYKHFKGKYYATMGTSKPIKCCDLINACKFKNIDPISLIKMRFTHTEIEEDITIFELDNKWYHLEEDSEDILVLYKSLHTCYGSYARPYEMFLSEVDREKYPNVEQKYRLEEVK